MRIAFHFHSVLAPMLGVLLSAASPAEANEGVAVFSDPSRIAGSAAPSPRSSTLGEESHLIARNSTSYYPKAALKVTDVAYTRQLSAEGVLSVNPSNMLALHGSGAKEAADLLAKSNGPFIELPGHHRHKGILEKSASEEGKSASHGSGSGSAWIKNGFRHRYKAARLGLCFAQAAPPKY
ncbi:hypothetical protein [Mesorhizobium temperatum]|uniref:Uncharacterized protein n=1 Tax=Mesorhizobium temperatum TaxID=241416 RepID=A0A271LRI5_9HYPH|nr:hypothetical protein CIT26_10165 [Mesorhizobium temperatum]